MKEILISIVVSITSVITAIVMNKTEHNKRNKHIKRYERINDIIRQAKEKE